MNCTHLFHGYPYNTVSAGMINIVDNTQGGAAINFNGYTITLVDGIVLEESRISSNLSATGVNT